MHGSRLIAMIPLIVLLTYTGAVPAAESGSAARARETVEHLDKPLYTPFTERYILDELKQVRTDMQSLRAELIEKVVDKELTVADKSMGYATNTITYFFYIILAATSLLAIAGWTTLRDIKKNVKDYADEEVARLTAKYEKRLQSLEEELNKKSHKIAQAQDEIDKTNEIHSLWLRSSQETSAKNKVTVYDQILELRPEDTEALTYKADAVLQLDEPQWAVSLCDKALEIDNENGHAFYQRACAKAMLNQEEEALRDLRKAIKLSVAFIEQAREDESFQSMQDNPQFLKLLAA